jgi:hypothetical protein
MVVDPLQLLNGVDFLLNQFPGPMKVDVLGHSRLEGLQPFGDTAGSNLQFSGYFGNMETLFN